MAWVYILKGSRYYVGSTNDLQRRLEEHRRGKTATTKRIGEWEIVKIIETVTLSEARMLERTIKRSGHVERYV